MTVYRNDLVCEVLSLTYDFEKRYGRLNIPALQSTDLGGCTELFQQIDPDVSVIEVLAGGKLNNLYKREESEWESYPG